MKEEAKDKLEKVTNQAQWINYLTILGGCLACWDKHQRKKKVGML